MKTILTVDDEPQLRWVLKNIFEHEGYTVLEAGSGDEGLAVLAQNDVDVVILDLQMPGKNGIQLLQEIRQSDPTIPVVILTAFGEVKTAVEATRLGAYDYLSKPVEKDAILVGVRRAIENHSLRREVNHWRTKVNRLGGTSILNPTGTAMAKVMERIKLVATTDYTVLITGDTGCGKDIAANMIHAMSKRADRIFIPVDCGALPDNLMESELFGYEKGAFTGADKRKEGLFELADGGTLFLDELGNLSPAAQAKLLRVLQDRKIMRLGAKQPKDIDVRVLVATNLKLEEQIAEGKFREDLYYRLNEFTITIPPLRERTDEIVPLAEFFLTQAGAELGKSLTLSDEIRDALKSYDWPGNIRQLKNVIRSAALTSHGTLGVESVPVLSKQRSQKQNEASSATDAGAIDQILNDGTPLKNFVRDYERSIIEEVIRRLGGDNKKAAQVLGIHYTTLLEKIK